VLTTARSRLASAQLDAVQAVANGTTTTSSVDNVELQEDFAVSVSSTGTAPATGSQSDSGAILRHRRRQRRRT
jgi:hypothetical protein